jgi:small subunit ribosomal protein S8
MVEDPVADMLTRIQNGAAAAKLSVDIPHTSFLADIAGVLANNGYIADFAVSDDEQTLRVDIEYGEDGESAISHCERISKPARRRYVSVDDIPEIRAGYGLVVLSTPEGVLSGDKARQQHVGGEVLFEMW